MPIGLALKQLVVSPSQQIAGSLDGLQWLLPIIGPGGYGYGTTLPTNTVHATMKGDVGTTYNVTLRFRGVVEQKTYSGGSNDGAFWQVGGSPDASDWNIYQLTISNPSQVYYLNRGSSGQFICYGIDYSKTIPINGGATVTLFANSVDAGHYEIYNTTTETGGYNPSTAISIPGITSPAQPYDGQFIQMDVTNVTF